MGLGDDVRGSRRSFVRRACLAGLGACAGSAVPGLAAAAAPSGSAASAGSAGSAGSVGAAAGSGEAASGGDLQRAWIAALLPGLAAGDPAEARRVLHGSAVAHFDALGMAATLEPYRGDLPAFLEFLRREWGWIVAHDPATDVVLVDENKEDCVCPLIGARRDASLGVLCYCSEGFAERMFSEVAGAPARARVTSSILRGDDRCRYRIELKP